MSAWRARAIAVLFASLSLGACTHRRATRPAPPSGTQQAPPPARPAGRYAQQHDSTPTQVPDISAIPEPVPRDEPRSVYGNKSPYTVLGKTYRVLPSCKGYDERGLASWYGNKFHGYTTSNFEKYDMYAYSAASKVLPIPCYVRVTNLDNGRSAIVRVNDRGPFVDGRVIDLSYVAAIRLGVWPKGTAHVRVQGIDPDQPASASEPLRAAAVPASSGKTHKPVAYVQVGAFADAANALRIADRLRAARLGPVRIERSARDGRVVQRVLVGPLADSDAQALLPRLRALGLGDARVSMDNR